MLPQQSDQTNKTEDECKWEQPTREVEDEDDDMLIHMEWDRLRKEFSEYLENETPTIEAIVAQHLNLRSHQACRVASRSQWLDKGTFNLCVPVFINNWHMRRVLVRCPFPHRLGGLHATALLEEKLRCEAASFAHLSRNHSRVPIPRLLGFGLPGGLHVSRIPLWNNWLTVSSSHLWNKRPGISEL